jgi:hypothetical protein
MDDGSFADYPVSLNEARADREQHAKFMTPRDALIATLRAIDSGEIAPTQLLVLYPKSDENQSIGFYNATPNSTVAAGLCAKGLGWFAT